MHRGAYSKGRRWGAPKLPRACQQPPLPTNTIATADKESHAALEAVGERRYHAAVPFRPDQYCVATATTGTASTTGGCTYVAFKTGTGCGSFGVMREALFGDIPRPGLLFCLEQQQQESRTMMTTSTITPTTDPTTMAMKIINGIPRMVVVGLNSLLMRGFS
mmetsp:Transcript_17864/g.50092  ORF Transcript_17864/g.50092 Transcript_17864/m.50092 type:complete len:162 (-) Transcript_17864:808-1293(-)